MNRLGNWLRPGSKTTDDVSDNESTKDSVAKEMEDIDDAMKSAALLMNDDIDGALERLKTGNSSFHLLGQTISIFLRSVLGFEKQVMAETADRLLEVETKATADYKKAQKHGKGRGGSTLYPPGTEFELVKAETQLMSAVVGVLHESVIEAMRSFYKMRKAFITLDGIIQAEEKAMTEAAGKSAASSRLAVNETTDENTSSVNNSRLNLPETQGTASGLQTPATSTRATTPIDDKFQELELNEDMSSTPIELKSRGVDAEPALLDNPLDIFVHSGANMCFGVMLLILSLLPPAFSRILSIVGFRGDRERGVHMLWRSTKYDNLNGAVAGMTLLAYYNGILGVVDILPDPKDFDEHAETVGPPREKCDQLLHTMRTRYPESRLWRVEEARQYGDQQNLAKAIEVLQTGTESKMKQVTALNNFELSVNALFIQDWNLMRDSFLLCMEINDWSPALYLYMAGIASIELYRDAFHKGDEVEARHQKKKAEEFIRQAPPLVGKKRFMARQLPFESFVQRKIQKWEDRAKANKIDLADAVGPSAAIEMCYMYNGPKRMSPADLERARVNLSWDRCTAGKEVVDKIKEEVDEMGIWGLCEAALLRRLGKFDDARASLEKHVLKHDRYVESPQLMLIANNHRNAFKGPTKDDYVLAAGIYEVGAIAWTECCNPPDGTEEEVKAYRKEKADECQKQLDVVKVWEAFLLDARIGMRVQSGLETLKWFKHKMEFE